MASCAKQLESHPDGQNQSTSRDYERSGNPIFILIVLRIKIYGRRELLRNRVSAKRVPQGEDEVTPPPDSDPREICRVASRLRSKGVLKVKAETYALAEFRYRILWQT